MGNYLGEFAALGTALAFAFGSTLFTLSGREVGSALVNRTRLLIAMLFIMGLHWLKYGQPIPLDAGFHPLFWLGLSGFVGFVLGDASLFQAFVMIGPRLSMLIMSLAPVLSVIMGWLFLDEVLTLQELLGIFITVAGIALVIAERRKPNPNGEPDDVRAYVLGLLLAFGGAAGQAGGAVLSKIGLANDFPALSGNLIRLSAAFILIWLLSIFRGELGSSFRTLRQNPRTVSRITLAAFIGPTMGVWLSLIALQQTTSVGIATTLMAMTPIFLIPIGYLFFRETITRQAILGTLIAFAGTILLFV